MRPHSPGFEHSRLDIRALDPADVSEVSALAKRTWADAFGSSAAPEELAAELERRRSESYFREALERDTILVARLGGRLVGYVQFGDVDIPDVDVRPGDQELHRVYVDTELHGRGIGRRLIEAALSHPRLAAARRICLQVWEQNTKAVGLYERLGFRAAGTTTFTIGSGQIVEDLIMVLDRSGDP